MNDDEKFLFKLPVPRLKPSDKKFKVRNPIWTDCKAKLIERYLYYFVLITKSGTYIDGFAGPQEPEKTEMWSAKLVLESTPRWLKNFYLFELSTAKVEMLREMVNGQPLRDKKRHEPKRNVQIYQGDFNEQVLEMLKQTPIKEKEATFCLLDQRTFECDWKTVMTLASHKKAGHKIELFYFFAEGWMNRSIKAIVHDKDARLKKWWGNSSWKKLLEISGAERSRFVSERFRSELGYKHSHPFPIYERKDEGGKIMYYMIHASDHDDAPTLMSRAYGRALEIKERPEQLEFLKPTPP